MDYIFSNSETLLTIPQVKTLFTHWMEIDRLNFHPDTPMDDYINGGSGLPALDPSKADHYNRLLDRCFMICENSGTDIYLLALECMRKILRDISSST